MSTQISAFSLALIALTAAVLAAALLVPLRALLLRRKILDTPNERSSHCRVMPRGGGLVIVILVLLGSAILLYESIRTLNPCIVAFIISSILVATVGWLDDLKSKPLFIRLLIQWAAALTIIIVCGPIRGITLPGLPRVDIGPVGYLLTFLWIVGLTNAFNFMDGIDGIAAGQSLIAGLALATAGLLVESPEIQYVATLIAGASLGFLLHNWHPARVFMGDVGSCFLGFTFACLPLLAINAQSHLKCEFLLIVALASLWPFIFDSMFTFIRRALNRENVFAAHRSHLYQRLVISGRSHALVSALYMGFSLLGFVISTVWVFNPATSLTFTTLPVASLLLLAYVRSAENHPRPRKTVNANDST